MIPLAVGVKTYLIYFLWIVWEINLSRPDFLDSEIVIWGLTSLTEFYKQVRLLLKKDMCQITVRKFLLSK